MYEEVFYARLIEAADQVTDSVIFIINGFGSFWLKSAELRKQISQEQFDKIMDASDQAIIIRTELMLRPWTEQYYSSKYLLLNKEKLFEALEAIREIFDEVIGEGGEFYYEFERFRRKIDCIKTGISTLLEIPVLSIVKEVDPELVAKKERMNIEEAAIAFFYLNS